MWTLDFWKDTVERVIATVAQVLIGLLTADGANLLTIDWAAGLTVIGTSAALVVLKSIVAVLAVKNTVSPASLVKEKEHINI